MADRPHKDFTGREVTRPGTVRRSPDPLADTIDDDPREYTPVEAIAAQIHAAIHEHAPPLSAEMQTVVDAVVIEVSQRTAEERARRSTQLDGMPRRLGEIEARLEDLGRWRAKLTDVIVFVTLPNGGNDTEAEQHTSDGAYVLHMTAPDQDRSVEQSYGWAWDARRPISNGHFAIITQGGVEYPASGSLIPAAAWYGTGVADTPTIHPGSQYTNTGHLEGMIEKFETWGPAP